MLATAFILGLLGSLHCLAMCGPIVFMLPVDRSSNRKKFLQTSAYHFGRLFSYASLGLVFGLLGKGFSLFGWQQQLSVAIGVLMVLSVLLPVRTLNKYNFSRHLYTLTAKLKNALGASLKKKNTGTFLTIGALNGLLPCGLVYIAVFGAVATAGLAKGAAYMFLFGLGTVPMMTAGIYLSSVLKEKARAKAKKLVPVFVVVVGLFFILRGVGLGIPYISPKPAAAELVASPTVKCH
jgi:sulfite exporter TauE/SafE